MTWKLATVIVAGCFLVGLLAVIAGWVFVSVEIFRMLLKP